MSFWEASWPRQQWPPKGLWICHFPWQKGPCRYDSVKDFEIEGFSGWARCDHKGSGRNLGSGDRKMEIEVGATWSRVGERGQPLETGSQGIDPLPESLKPCGPVDPSLAPVGLVSDFRPPELYDNKLVFAALCRSSSRREGMRAWSATWLSLVIPFLKVGTRDPGVRGWRSRGLNPRPRAVARVRSAP